MRYLERVPRPSAMTCLGKVPRLSSCLDTVTRAIASLDTMPRPSALSFLSKVPRPSTCLDMVTPHSACLETVPRPNATTCLGFVPLPSACLNTVPRPSAMPSKGASAKCHAKPRQGPSAWYMPRHGDSA